MKRIFIGIAFLTAIFLAGCNDSESVEVVKTDYIINYYEVSSIKDICFPKCTTKYKITETIPDFCFDEKNCAEIKWHDEKCELKMMFNDEKELCESDFYINIADYFSEKSEFYSELEYYYGILTDELGEPEKELKFYDYGEYDVNWRGEPLGYAEWQYDEISVILRLDINKIVLIIN